MLKLLRSLENLRVEEADKLTPVQIDEIINDIRKRFQKHDIDFDKWSRDPNNHTLIFDIFTEIIGFSDMSLIGWYVPNTKTEAFGYSNNKKEYIGVSREFSHPDDKLMLATPSLIGYGVGSYEEDKYLVSVREDSYTTPFKVHKSEKKREYGELNPDMFKPLYIIENLKKIAEQEGLENVCLIKFTDDIDFKTTDGVETNVNRFLTQAMKTVRVTHSKHPHSWYPKFLSELGFIRIIENLPDGYIESKENIGKTLNYLRHVLGFETFEEIKVPNNAFVPVDGYEVFVAYPVLSKGLPKDKSKTSTVKSLIKAIL